MAKEIEVSEIFMSLEGEAAHSAKPTAYVRFARCQFTCSGFNNPTNERDAKDYAPVTFDPANFTNIKDLPLITRGCDSQYAVNPAFSHMWEKLTIDEIATRLVEVLPRNRWVHPDTGLPVILSLTGGEPTLLWKRIPELLNHPLLEQCKHVLIETNCGVPIKWKFVEDLNQWLCQDQSRKITWSNSPKLTSSGEKWSAAINPHVALMQRAVTGSVPGQSEQYFKFVVGPRQADFDEVRKAMNEYYLGDIPKSVQVWLMPEACTQEQQQTIDKQVANMCMEQGFLFCYRFQNALWGNGVGT